MNSVVLKIKAENVSPVSGNQLRTVFLMSVIILLLTALCCKPKQSKYVCKDSESLRIKIEFYDFVDGESCYNGCLREDYLLRLSCNRGEKVSAGLDGW